MKIDILNNEIICDYTPHHIIGMCVYVCEKKDVLLPITSCVVTIDMERGGTGFV